MAKILLVDDDEVFREAVEVTLTSEGHQVTTAVNGKIALSTFDQEAFDLVVSDIRMPEMEGTELTRRIRAKSSTPIILTTGFSEITETQDAYKLGANEFIPKPFKREDLLAAIQRCLTPASSVLAEDQNYCKLGINDFVTGRTIKFNIFVRLSANKFIKLAHKGEDISMDRIRFFRQKGLNFLYLKREDFRQYVGFSVSLTSAARGNQILDREKKLNLLRHSGEVLNEQIRHDGIDEQLYESSRAFVEATLDFITDDAKAVEVLEALRNHSDHILAHSVGVGLYSTMLAQALEWNMPANRFKVAMGGILHDVGLKEIDRKLLERSRYTWTSDEVKLYETHPFRGVAILNDLQNIPDDVREIVRQHHENCLALGYPSRMKKAAIHPMAKVVSVADEFCYRIIKNPEIAVMEPHDALQELTINYSDRLDKNFLETLTSLFFPTAKTNARQA